MASATRVLIVDDSAVVRQVLTSVFAADPGLDVIGAVSDPLFAMERMNKQWPDVVVLDIEMPRMDGLTFLKKVMAVRPTPVVICSTLTAKGADVTMDAMAAGAVGVVAKPLAGLRQFLEHEAPEFVRTVKAAAAGNIGHVRAATAATARVARPAGGDAAAPATLRSTTDSLVAIGTSTGGTQALELVLTSLPRLQSGVVVVQHMPEHFTAAFAERLDRSCRADVAEARDGDRVLPGRILIAPGGQHMSVERDGAQYRVRVSEGERVNRHRPSVDVLFNSVAACAGPNALGVIMTGMGDDGAAGLRSMRDAGAQTIGQNEATCVVYGMPRAAFELGAVQTEVALGDIAGAIQGFAQRKSTR